MTFYLFWPEKATVSAAGFGKVCTAPCIFDGTWTYFMEASWYLRDRSMGGWPRAGGRKQTKASMSAYGSALCDFFEWCERRGKDWKEVDYDDLLDMTHGYQAEMQRGTWSVSGAALAASTVNTRVDQACMFLQWAHAQSLRGKFYVPTNTVSIKHDTARNSHGHKARQVETRVGKVRTDPKRLRLPTDAQVQKWLRAVRIEKGETKALMCELIVQTAIRREEAVQWRVDTLPEQKKDWDVRGGSVSVLLMYGTKGPKYGSVDGERGPSRIIKIPLYLAEKLHDYRIVRRAVLRAMYVRCASSIEEKRARMREITTRLFLSDFTGEPVSSMAFYSGWKNVSHLPYVEWSPHLGRHYWACKTLMDDVARSYENIRRGEIPPADWATGQAANTLMMQIKPQLGHVSAETTQLYLAWIRDAYSMGGFALEYANALEDVFEEDTEHHP